MNAQAALAGLKPFEEFMRDPWLTVACVLLIGVSVAWIVVSRLIVANIKRSESRAGRGRRKSTG
jgi:hypothetical protein